jgi:hypothetical protein
MTTETYEGGCICGAVRYRVSAPLAPVLACHCRQCRRMSGHYFAATAAPHDAFEVTESSGLAWYQSSETSRRGFCKSCGSSLFFDHGPDEPLGISAGSLDGDPPLTLVAHIYVDEAGPYYELADQAEQFTREVWLRGGWQRFRLD